MTKEIKQRGLKVLCLILVVMVALSIVGCGKKDSKGDGSGEANANNTENVVVVDSDGIKITLVKFDRAAIMGAAYQIKIENSTDKIIRVYLEKAVLDTGIEDSSPKGHFNADIEAKGTVEKNYDIEYELGKEELEKATSVEFTFSISELEKMSDAQSKEIKTFDPVKVDIPKK